MRTNLKRKSMGAEDFFKGQGIQPEKKILDSDFSNSLREKVHSLYLDFTDQKMKWLLAKKKLLLFGGGFLAFVLVAASLVTLTVPSVRNSVVTTAANLFGKDQKQEENVEQPDKEEADTTAPELSITAPEDGASTVDGKLTITGKTEPGARVFVGESEVDNIEGEFSKEVYLVDGENKIVIKAKDAAGNETSKTLTIIKKEGIEPTPTPKPDAKIALSGAAVDGGIKLTWTVSNLDITKGFKVLKGSGPDSVNSVYKYIEGNSTRSVILPITNGATYYFRICQYTGSGCGVYSNIVKVTAPGTTISIGTVSGPTYLGERAVGWSYSGSGQGGFKIVWSSDANPVYPDGADGTYGDDFYNYVSNPSATSGGFAWDAPAGTVLHVRVCAYYPDGGGCKAYSNDLQVTL